MNKIGDKEQHQQSLTLTGNESELPARTTDQALTPAVHEPNRPRTQRDIASPYPQNID